MAEEIGFRIRVDGAQEQLDTMAALKEQINALAIEKQKLNKNLHLLQRCSII